MSTVIYLIPFQGDQATRASQVALVVTKPPVNTGDVTHGVQFLGAGHDSPLQYFYLENPADREPWGLHSMGLQKVGHN